LPSLRTLVISAFVAVIFGPVSREGTVLCTVRTAANQALHETTAQKGSGQCGELFDRPTYTFTMFTLFKSRPKLPASFERWREVDTIAGSELLYEGPSVLDVRSLKQWLDAYRRWRDGYDAFVKAAATLGGDGSTDEFDRRQYEHYTGLFFQSGQWHAILLMLLEGVSESERSRYLTELDGLLADLRERMIRQ
jgi:hypothetical protein